MDARMLFDMDNLDATILPASNRTMRLPTLPSNDKLDSKIRDIPQTPRAHLHTMTNINESQHGHSSWGRPAHIQATNQWPQLQENHYSSPQSLRHIPSNQTCTTPGIQYREPSSSAAISFLSNTGIYDVNSPAKLSPAQSREDLQWQMYLTASLSNPFNSLEFVNPNSSPLSYPSAMQENFGTDAVLPMDSALFPSSNSSAFCPNQVADIFNSPPFVDVSQMPSAFSSSNNISASQSHHSFAGIALPQHQEILRENPVSPTGAPNGTYASLLGLTSLENFDMTSAVYESPSQCQITGSMTLLPPHEYSPPRGRSQVRIVQSPDRFRGRRGLSGWNNNMQPEAMSARTHLPTSCATKRGRSTSVSPSANIRRPYQASPLSTNANVESTSFSHQAKRPRPPNPSAHLFATEEEDSEGEANNLGDDSESDDYHPSRSASPESPVDPFGLGRAFSLESSQHRIVPSTPPKRKSRRGKGKAKGSAALALAVVTQLGSKGVQSRASSSDQLGLDGEEFDAMALYQEGRTGIRKRKNNPIPLPVPIPNLNKKSRGRKVPFVADLSGDSLRRSTSVLSADNNINVEAPDDAGDSGAGYVPRSTRRAKSLRRTSTPAPVVDDAGCRTYVCVIPGCGKCFVRGEHLKRHVRSIHTHDKPHPCPYEGCDKSFSRRDNLGQHVRIHLQP